VVVRAIRPFLLAAHLLGEKRTKRPLLANDVHLRPGVQRLPRGGELLDGQVLERGNSRRKT
jgi:hypothetical protein